MTEATSKLSPFASHSVLNFSHARFPRQFSNAITRAISVTSATTENRILFSHFIQRPPLPDHNCEVDRPPALACAVRIYPRQAQPTDVDAPDTPGPCREKDGWRFGVERLPVRRR